MRYEALNGGNVLSSRMPNIGIESDPSKSSTEGLSLRKGLPPLPGGPPSNFYRFLRYIFPQTLATLGLGGRQWNTHKKERNGL